MIYLVYAVVLTAVGFCLLMLQSISAGAKRRSARHRQIQDRRLGR